MKNFVYFVAMFLLVNSAVFAGESRKVAGDFKVIKIQKNMASDFTIKFKPVAKNKSINLMVLNTDHVHSQISEGDVVRLSAEVVRLEAKVATVSQLVIFYNSIRREKLQSG